MRAHRVVGGIGGVVRGMVGELGADTISFGQLLQAVAGGGPLHRAPTGARSPPIVVLACSLVPMRRVRFEPALPEPLARAVAELGYGTVTKTGAVRRTHLAERIRDHRAGVATHLRDDRGARRRPAGADGLHRRRRRPPAGRARRSRPIATVAGDVAHVRRTDEPLVGVSRAWSKANRATAAPTPATGRAR
ncbi:MAG: hypothetical protein R2713_16180 [Ilumatobacteraceae bacterium]